MKRIAEAKWEKVKVKTDSLVSRFCTEVGGQ